MRTTLRLTPVLVAAILLLAGCATTQRNSQGEKNRGVDRVSPVRAAEVNTRLGIGYMERGKYELAVDKLERAVEHDPEHVPAYLTLALLYEQIGAPDQAGDHYERAARLAPDDGATQNSYGAYLCRHGQFEDAVERFLNATEDPFYETPEVALTNAGACARRIPDPARAERFLRRALEMRSGFAEALYHMADLSYQQGNAFQARAFLQRYESAAGHEAGTLLLGYRIETALGNAEGASGYASRLRRNYPDSQEARTLKADKDS